MRISFDNEIRKGFTASQSNNPWKYQIPQSLCAVVCSAGITCIGPFECEPMDTFKRVFETNVLGHMDIIHTLIKVCSTPHSL